jgi:hypothetical protein
VTERDINEVWTIAALAGFVGIVLIATTAHRSAATATVPLDATDHCPAGSVFIYRGRGDYHCTTSFREAFDYCCEMSPADRAFNAFGALGSPLSRDRNPYMSAEAWLMIRRSSGWKAHDPQL